MKPIKEGKVREIYDNGDSLIMVATDRISCFDVILNNEVTKKGTVLTQMSKFWFDMTEDIIPNHMISVDVKDMPDDLWGGDRKPFYYVEIAPVENGEQNVDCALVREQQARVMEMTDNVGMVSTNDLVYD